MNPFGRKHLDLLQNIEFGIIQVYRSDPTLLDIDAQDAIDALIRYYHSEEEQRTPSAPRLSDRAQRVFLSVQEICEFRLGRRPMTGESVRALPVSDLVKGLREIQKSIPRWTKQRGRKGYLDFVSEFLP